MANRDIRSGNPLLTWIMIKFHCQPKQVVINMFSSKKSLKKGRIKIIMFSIHYLL